MPGLIAHIYTCIEIFNIKNEEMINHTFYIILLRNLILNLNKEFASL